MRFPVSFPEPVRVRVQENPSTLLTQYARTDGPVIQFQVPQSKLWQIHDLYLVYQASAVYGERQMQLLFTNEDNNSICEIASMPITRGRFLYQSLYPLASSVRSTGPGISDFEIASCPDVLYSSYTVILGAEGIQAGDYYSLRIRYYEL